MAVCPSPQDATIMLDMLKEVILLVPKQEFTITGAKDWPVFLLMIKIVGESWRSSWAASTSSRL